MHIVCYTDGRLCSMKCIYIFLIIIKYFGSSVAGYIEVLFQKHKICRPK